MAKRPKRKQARSRAQRAGPVSWMYFPARVPGQRAEAAKPKAKAGDSGRARQRSQRVMGMVRFRANCPSRAGSIQAPQKVMSSAAAGTEAQAERLGPSRSQRKPPAVFPAKTKPVVSRISAGPVCQGKLTAAPPTARTPTAAVSRTAASRGLLTVFPGASQRRPSVRGSGFPLTNTDATPSTASRPARTGPAAGKRLPTVTPMAPGATKTPSGAAFPPLPSMVSVPAATWKTLLPRPISSRRGRTGRGRAKPAATQSMAAAAEIRCFPIRSAARPTRHWVEKARVL